MVSKQRREVGTQIIRCYEFYCSEPRWSGAKSMIDKYCVFVPVVCCYCTHSHANTNATWRNSRYNVLLVQHYLRQSGIIWDLCLVSLSALIQIRCFHKFRSSELHIWRWRSDRKREREWEIGRESERRERTRKEVSHSAQQETTILTHETKRRCTFCHRSNTYRGTGRPLLPFAHAAMWTGRFQPTRAQSQTSVAGDDHFNIGVFVPPAPQSDWVAVADRCSYTQTQIESFASENGFGLPLI